MQIVPNTSKQNHDEKFSSARNGRDSFGFTQIFAEHFSNAPAEITPEVSANYSDTRDVFATVEPYDTINSYDSTNDSVGSTIPLKDIRLTDSELDQVISYLESQNIPTDSLQELKGSIEGVKIDDVVKAVVQNEPVKLSEGDIDRIKKLADAIDSSGILGQDLLSSIRNGKSLQAWERFSTALLNQGNKTFSINQADLVSFAKGLGVKPETIDALSKSFEGKKNMSFTVEKLKQLMVPLQQEMTNKLDAQSKLSSKLEAALMPVVKEARNRIENENAASELISKKVQQSELLIRDTSMQKGFNDLANVNSINANGLKGNVLPENGKNELATGIPSSAQEQFSGQFDGKDSHQGKDTFDKRKNNKSIFAELGVNKENANPWSILTQNFTLTQGVNTVTPLANQAQTVQSGWDLLASKMVAHIEQGAFTALKNGVNRLELQINPLELGTVNVILTTKNGEISAMIRPEREETTTALMQQMDTLRAELEKQGVKVDKVEVQTQLKDGQNMGWQNTDQHNNAQEQQARVRDLEKLRMLGRTKAEDSTVNSISERNMHSVMYNNSERLYIVT